MKMAKFIDESYISLLFFSFLFLQVFVVYAEQIPALYIFGGSDVDCGNNVNTKMRAFYEPYGIDFPLGITGRFTNGRTIVDWLGEFVGLDSIVCYLDIANKGGEDKEIDGMVTRGLNFASGSAGILQETGGAVGDNWSIEEQIAEFSLAVKRNLPIHFNYNDFQLTQHLETSIFMVFIGISDYINNYLQPNEYNSSKNLTPEEFGELLSEKLSDQLKKLYKLGARKIIAFQIGPVGCFPAVLNSMKSKTKCINYFNDMVSIFNQKLDTEVEQLRFFFADATISIARIFNLMLEIIENPASFGFKETKKPRCTVGQDGTGLCIPREAPCENRNETLFWDDYNLSEAANRLIAENCHIGSRLCSPVNIYEVITSGQPRQCPGLDSLIFVMIIAGFSSL